MGEIRKKQLVLPFVAAFASEQRAVDRGREMLSDVFGEPIFMSRFFRFDEFTDYYEPSMGRVLYKQLWSFGKLWDPENLADLKITTNGFEEEYARQSHDTAAVKRPLNLDPGYIDLGKLVLASTKDHSHRIYLRNGIFAEVTLIYTKKIWQKLPWTYPDYQSSDYHEFLNQSRDYLHAELNRK